MESGRELCLCIGLLMQPWTEYGQCRWIMGIWLQHRFGPCIRYIVGIIPEGVGGQHNGQLQFDFLLHGLGFDDKEHIVGDFDEMTTLQVSGWQRWHIEAVVVPLILATRTYLAAHQHSQGALLCLHCLAAGQVLNGLKKRYIIYI